MKNLIIPFFGALMAVSCQQKGDAPAEAEDPDWVKLEIPTGRSAAGEQAFSIIGDIDHTLLVSTLVGLYTSTDHGKTWQKLRNTSQTFFALAPRHDTIFALNSYQTNSQGEKLAAASAEEFSTDYGRTWAYTAVLGPNSYPKYRAFRYPIGQVNAAGLTYRVRENRMPVPNTNATVGVAADLLRIDAAGNQRALRLPARHSLNNVYLDAQKRLYVAASGERFDAATGTIIDYTKGQGIAVVYVSRQPLP